MTLLRALLIVLLLFSIATAQQTDSSQTGQPSVNETIAVWTTTGIVVPLAIAGVVISAVPPSFTTVFRNGNAYGGISFESGVGLGTFRETGIFSDWRFAVGYSYIVSSKVKDIARLEVKKDIKFDFVDRRKIFLAGLNLSAGLMTDFPNKGFTAGGGVWLQTPWLSYFGFFPQHTIG
ncbi:MAG: hypothetical protein ACOYNS_15880, partial [Bacteroidota bacterium]